MIVLPNGFSHRDDAQTRPLGDALELGFRWIELDVWQLFGRLLVGHDPVELRPARTLRTLYLEPIAALHRAGRLGEGEPIWLVVDAKTRGRPVHDALERLAHEFDDLVADPTVPHDERPLRVIQTGNRPSYLDAARRPGRRTSLDGRIRDAGVHTDARVMPIVSDDWTRFSSWRGEGAAPAGELARLSDLVETVHAHGQRLRMWATPDRPGAQRTALWTTLLDLGVDLINTDDLSGLAAFLHARSSRAEVR